MIDPIALVIAIASPTSLVIIAYIQHVGAKKRELQNALVLKEKDAELVRQAEQRAEEAAEASAKLDAIAERNAEIGKLRIIEEGFEKQLRAAERRVNLAAAKAVKNMGGNGDLGPAIASLEELEHKVRTTGDIFSQLEEMYGITKKEN